MKNKINKKIKNKKLHVKTKQHNYMFKKARQVC